MSSDELRSANGQIEFLLRRAPAQTGDCPGTRTRPCAAAALPGAPSQPPTGPMSAESGAAGPERGRAAPAP
ncbi:hypothetical protein [Streptomyces sp. JNUCC 63]